MGRGGVHAPRTAVSAEVELRRQRMCSGHGGRRARSRRTRHQQSSFRRYLGRPPPLRHPTAADARTLDVVVREQLKHLAQLRGVRHVHGDPLVTRRQRVRLLLQLGHRLVRLQRTRLDVVVGRGAACARAMGRERGWPRDSRAWGSRARHAQRARRRRSPHPTPAHTMRLAKLGDRLRIPEAVRLRRVRRRRRGCSRSPPSRAEHLLDRRLLQHRQHLRELSCAQGECQCTHEELCCATLRCAALECRSVAHKRRDDRCTETHS